MRRRDLLLGAAASGGVALGAGWAILRSSDSPTLRSEPPTTSTTTTTAPPSDPYGPLLPPDGNRLQLPRGFSSRVIATSGERVPGTEHVWHADPDGGATFPTANGGWIYVSNSESGGGLGGVGAVAFDADGEIVAARTILSGTSRNCAGGPTPWDTWLSCEEHDSGLVWECDPRGDREAVARADMGAFMHEAAAVDSTNECVYLTEDRGDGGLYRFVPDAYPDLSSGTLQILVDSDGGLSWSDVPNPASTNPATRDQVPGIRRFHGGEGAWFHEGILWFTTKGDGRVWTLDPATMALEIAYDDSTAEDAALTGVDNITVADGAGDVFVAEDGGNMEICLLVPTGTIPFLRVTGVTGSEVTGPAFSPDGTRLYFSSQRNPGRTYEVTGPFRGATS